MTDINRYTTEYLRHYDEESFELFLIGARRQRVLKSIRKYPHKSILEVGCGVEPLFMFLEDYDAYTVVDPSEEFVRRARRDAQSRANLRVLQGYLEDLADTGSLRTRSPFDFIIVSSLLHEVPDPSRLLQVVRRLSGPATTVHINVPNVYSFHRLLALEMGLIRNLFEPSDAEIRFQRRTRFDREALHRIVEENGFRVLHFETYLVKPFSNDQMEKLLKHGIIGPETIEALGAMSKHLPEMGCEMFLEAKIR